MNIYKYLLLIASTLIATATTGQTVSSSDYDLPAVGGYDLISYYQGTEPVRGSGYYKVQHEGVTYLFANESNQVIFKRNPEKYLPAYNGYCAYGVTVGKKYNTDPTVYKVVNGKLYLNLDSEIQEEWSKDIQGNIAKADKKWESIN